jgi:poly(A) polymerase Pap1
MSLLQQEDVDLLVLWPQIVSREHPFISLNEQVKRDYKSLDMIK